MALRDSAGERTDVAVTRVRFRELDEHTIDWYLVARRMGDCAGGYAIQGKGRRARRADRGRLLERRRPAGPGSSCGWFRTCSA